MFRVVATRAALFAVVVVVALFRPMEVATGEKADTETSSEARDDNNNNDRMIVVD
jgi:hypothetical protein